MTTTLPSKTAVKKSATKTVTAASAAVKPTVVRKTAAAKTSSVRAATVAPAARAKPPAKATAKLPAKAKLDAPIAFPKSIPEAVAAVDVKEKIKKAKLIRDSFTMPEIEYAALGEVKKNCLKAGLEVKKSELLRIGVALIRDLDLAALKAAVAALSPLKPGRPRKEK